jgi:hypothetical protein
MTNPAGEIRNVVSPVGLYIDVKWLCWREHALQTSVVILKIVEAVRLNESLQ